MLVTMCLHGLPGSAGAYGAMACQDGNKDSRGGMKYLSHVPDLSPPPPRNYKHPILGFQCSYIDWVGEVHVAHTSSVCFESWVTEAGLLAGVCMQLQLTILLAPGPSTGTCTITPKTWCWPKHVLCSR